MKKTLSGVLLISCTIGLLFPFSASSEKPTAEKEKVRDELWSVFLAADHANEPNLAEDAVPRNSFNVDVIEALLSSGTASQKTSPFFDLPQWERQGITSGYFFNLNQQLPPWIKNIFWFASEGGIWTRYFLHPKDEKYGSLLLKYFSDRSIPFRLVRANPRFEAWSTASRSMIVRDGESQRRFSFRPSTSRTFNDRRDRPNPLRWAYLARKLSDRFQRLRPYLRDLDFAEEALAVGIPPIFSANVLMGDIGGQVRLMEDLNEGRSTQVSSFALRNPKTLASLLQKSGLSREVFLSKVAEAWGGAIVELAVLLGVHATSAHGQNIRIELDTQFRPTGRMIFIDLTDVRPNAAFWIHDGDQELLSEWTRQVGTSNPVNSIETIGFSSFQMDYQSLGFNGAKIAELAVARRLAELGLTDSEFIEAFKRRSHVRSETGTTLNLENAGLKALNVAEVFRLAGELNVNSRERISLESHFLKRFPKLTRKVRKLGCSSNALGRME